MPVFGQEIEIFGKYQHLDLVYGCVRMNRTQAILYVSIISIFMMIYVYLTLLYYI
jgi:hypothetical protein